MSSITRTDQYQPLEQVSTPSRDTLSDLPPDFSASSHISSSSEAPIASDEHIKEILSKRRFRRDLAVNPAGEKSKGIKLSIGPETAKVALKIEPEEESAPAPRESYPRLRAFAQSAQDGMKRLRNTLSGPWGLCCQSKLEPKKVTVMHRDQEDDGFRITDRDQEDLDLLPDDFRITNEDWADRQYTEARSFEELGTLMGEKSAARESLKKLPSRDEYNCFTGSEIGDSLTVDKLVSSPLGKHLISKGYEIVEALNTSGQNSQCFLVKDEMGRRKFLKVLKTSNWDPKVVRSLMLSPVSGDGAIIDEKLNAHVLSPTHIFSLNQDREIVASPDHDNLMLAEEFDLVSQPQELGPYISEGSLSNWDEVRGVFGQILEGAEDLEKHGITHRDLTPQNILIDSQGQVKIIDFGLAIKGDAPCEPLGGMYTAPAREKSKKIDSFSLGLVLFQMVTGKKPSDIYQATGRTYREEIMSGNIPVPSETPDNITKVLNALLKVDPNERCTIAEAQTLLAAKEIDNSEA